ncbi:unnamed protein product, partial [marine sediment metagenome]
LRVSAKRVAGWWKDTGKPEDLLQANRLVLSQIARDVSGEVVDADVAGEVVVAEGARIVRSEVRGPAHIAAGAVIEDGYVGPYTSIGQDARVIRSEIEYSILMDEAELRNLPRRVDASVIGQGVRVEGRGGDLRQNTLQLFLGDQSQVRL